MKLDLLRSRGPRKRSMSQNNESTGHSRSVLSARKSPTPTPPPPSQPSFQNINSYTSKTNANIGGLNDGSNDFEFENVASDREQFSNWQKENNGGNGAFGSSSRNMIWYFFLVVVLVAFVVTLALLAHTLLRSTTTILVGPPGPEGSCNLSQVNQTFNIYGTLNVGGNETVNGSLTVNNSLSIYYDNASHCVAFDTNVSAVKPPPPVCFKSCIETNCIQSLGGGGGGGNNVTFNSTVFFNDTVYVNQTLWIGETELYWNGTSLVFNGSVSIPPQSGGGIIVGNVGNITQDGNCLLINATNCLELEGPIISFLSQITGPFYVNGTATFFPSVYLFNSSYGLFLTEDDLLEILSSKTLSLNASSTIVNGNFSVLGAVTGSLNVAGSLALECPTNASEKVVFAFDAACDCLNVGSTTSGMCFNVKNGLTFNGPGNLNVNGTNVTFSNGAVVNSGLTVTGNLTVDQNLNVLGAVVYQDLTVSGNFTATGGFNVTSTVVNFLEVDANVIKANQIVSKNVTTFQGQGAIFNSGATLQVNGNLQFNVLSSNLFCASPIFIPNTPSTPTNNSCVLACTDMSLCTTTINNLVVAQAFSVGTSSNFSLIGSVSLGIIGAQRLSSMQINTYSLEINSNTSVKIDNNLNVQGNILQGSNTHPCCLGQQVNTGARTLILQMSGSSTSIATSETSVVPFNTQTNPVLPLSASWDTGTYTFTAPTSGFYGVTVYLAMNPSQSASGTLRGVTLLKSYSYPSNTPAKTRICAQPTDNTGTSLYMQITCTYAGYFGGGDTFQVTVYFDYAGPLTLFGSADVTAVPSTRLEIYQF